MCYTKKEGGSMTGEIRLNNSDREQWIDNDEGLYLWWKSTKLSKRKFIQENKAELDALIKAQLTRKPQR